MGFNSGFKGLNVTTTLLVDAFWWIVPLVGILVYAREELFCLTVR